MPASQRAAPSEALINNTAIVTPDAQKIPHITTPNKVEPKWRKSNRTIEMINEMIINPSNTRAARLPTSSYSDTIPAFRQPSMILIASVSAVNTATRPCHNDTIDCFNHTCTCCAKQSNAAGADATHASCCTAGTTRSRNTARAGSSKRSTA